MIAIIDYGIGNIKSVANMLRKAGHDSQIANDPFTLERADKIILPGVGAFDAGMENLEKSGLIDALTRRVFSDRIPILGICLGMQLFAKSSEEGKKAGLGWINADIKRFDFSGQSKVLKVPHMGWNYIKIEKQHPIFEGVPEPMRFYFVHSYHYSCHDKSAMLGTANYGYDFICCIAKDNIIGVQFHPEKSHKYGMKLLKNFSDDC